MLVKHVFAKFNEDISIEKSNTNLIGFHLELNVVDTFHFDMFFEVIQPGFDNNGNYYKNAFDVNCCICWM
jgi:hypothetical protein